MSKLDEGEYSGALDAWRTEFRAREDSLEATWELAEIEERWGDAFFFGGEPGARAHYQAAQRALMPPGMLFSSREENDRRMQSYERLTQKLYAVDPDDRARPGHAAAPHPRFKPAPPREQPAPSAPPKPARPKPVVDTPETMQPTGLAQVYRDSGHFCHYGLGQAWRDAARDLAANHPADAHRACGWSLYFYGLYNAAWTAHLPASRWDSDGGQEMMEVQTLRDSLAAGDAQSPTPDWAAHMLEGDWQKALAALAGKTPEPEYRSVATLLADASKAADGQRASVGN